MLGMIDDKSTVRRWIARRWIVLLAGAVLAGTGPALWLALRPSHRSLLFWLCWISPLPGVVLALAAARLREDGRWLARLRLVVTNALVLVAMLGAGEVAFRVARFDFDRVASSGEAPRESYPICFRIPEQPLPEVFFKRPGSIEWTGRPLSTFLRIRHGTDGAYEDERSFTSKYDADGFRNPPDLHDWDVVVTGDSFTETGYLPMDEIFTTAAARESGLRIRNLGVCNTGTLAHARYLRHFGGAPSCKIAVLAFYDGNDVLDAEEEAADLEKNRATGWRPTRDLGPQTSLLKALYRVAKGYAAISPDRRYQNAWLTAGGHEAPITMRAPPMPLDPETMTAHQKEVLERALDEWIATAREMKLEPHVLYLPANNRTYHGLVRFDENAPTEGRDWTPGSLPAFVRSFCEKRGARFIDACPALREMAAQGVLVYNPILDTHLNRAGSRLVGELLAKALRDANSSALQKSRP